MPDIYLYRAKFTRSDQAVLGDDNRSPSALMVDAIGQRPSHSYRDGIIWSVANLQTLTATTGVFRLGKQQSTVLERFDEDSRDFVEEEQDQASTTRVYYDAEIGIVGIVRRTALAPTPAALGRRLAGVLQATEDFRVLGVEVNVDTIPDPQGFIDAMNSAYRVTRFAATFGRPNPFDADELFQKPLAVYLDEVDGDTGVTKVVSKDGLDTDVLAAVTRSTAATGNDAKATLRPAPRRPTRNLSLNDNPIMVQVEEDEAEPAEVIAEMRAKYREVRSGE